MQVKGQTGRGERKRRFIFLIRSSGIVKIYTSSNFIVSGNYYFTRLSRPELPACLLAFGLTQTQQQKHKRCLFHSSSGYYKFHLQMESILMLFCRLELPVCSATHIHFITYPTGLDHEETHCTIKDNRRPLRQEARAPQRQGQEHLFPAPEAAEPSLSVLSCSVSLCWKYSINLPRAGLMLQ